MATLDTLATRPDGTDFAAGKAYFETSNNKFIVWNGSSWLELDSEGTGAVQFLNRWGASFDGTKELAIPQGTFNLGSDLFSFSLWFNADSLNDYNVLFRINSDTLYSCSSFIRSNGQIYLSNWTYNQLVSTGNTINTGAWNHLAYVKSTTGSAGIVTIYYNGSSVASGPVPNGSNFGSETGTSSIGRSYSGDYPFDGKIDEFAFWDSALSADDITAIYSNGKPTDLTLAGSYDTDRTANLKGYWRMGDDSNDSPSSDPTSNSIVTITDSSGNGNDATQATASSQPTFKALDQSTTSLSFDGNDDYLHTASFTLGATYSFSMWFNFDAQASISNNALLNSEHYYTDGYDNFVFRISNATTMHLYSYSGLSSAQAITITVPTLSTGTWYNLVLTNSGSGSAQGYLNGNIVTTSGSTSRAFTDLQNTKGLIIGDNLTNNNKPFDGELDEVAVFNTALSASEVSSLAASRGAHIKDDLGLTPFAYYRMGEDDNLTDGQTGISQITDASGNGNHATQATAANQPTASVSPVIYV